MKLFPFFIVFTLAMSCGKEHPLSSVAPSSIQHLIGSYIGFPGENAFSRSQNRGMLNLTIQKIDEKTKTMSGKILHEGEIKTFQSTYRIISGRLQARRENDKVFKIEIDLKGRQATLLRSGFAVKADLKRRDFTYDPNLKIDPKIGATHFNASTEKLKLKDLEGLSNYEIRLTRLAIYARHGLAFFDPSDRFFFERATKWYAPYFAKVDNKLIALEKANIVVLQSLEKPRSPLGRP